MRAINTTLVVSLFLLCSVSLAEDNSVPYPEGYRSWAHIKTMLIQPGHPLENPFQGIHHIYANKKAQQGLHSGKYRDGAVIVFDLLNYIEQDATVQEADRKLIGVMYKDAKKYSKTGGWGFEAFAGDSQTDRLVNDDGNSCFACHTSQKANDFVFSRPR